MTTRSDSFARSALSAPSWWHQHGWSVGVVAVAAVLAMPIVIVLSFVLQPAGEVWRHLVETVLADYVVNSVLLMMGVGVGTLLLGVGSAWLTTQYQFPGRDMLIWALLLPLSMPAYITAYTYTGMLDYAGPLQSQLRDWFGWTAGDYWFPEIRSLYGAMAMLSFVLYPYVYLLSRAAFLEQSISIADASRLLGCSPWQSFRRVTLPVARPAIIAGLSLALMETLADYGTVQYFGVDTFTIGIFRTWFGFGDSAAAAQLSSVLLAFVFVLMVLERWSRKRAQYHHVGSRSQPLQVQELSGWAALAAIAACALPLMLGFILPTGQLVYWAYYTADEMLNPDFYRLLRNSIGLAGGSALLAVAVALFIAYGKRLTPNRAILAAARTAGLGYAIPGTVIAVGVMLPLAWIDNTVDYWFRQHFGISTGLVLSGTLVAVVFAYMVRFLAVSLQAVESGLAKVKHSMDDAARSLGYRPIGVLRYVHIPIISGSLLTAGLIVFVDILKELPATLVLRPFNFNTLAVRAFELASDERLADSAIPAITIVVAGLVPVILLSRAIARSRTMTVVGSTPGNRRRSPR